MESRLPHLYSTFYVSLFRADSLQVLLNNLSSRESLYQMDTVHVFGPPSV